MKIFSATQIRQWDAFTVAHEPISSVNLMERAATACFTWLINQFKSSNNFAIFCGTGNNGGDGLAIARMLLKSDYSVSVYILDGEKRSTDFITNLNRIEPILPCTTLISPSDFPNLPQDCIVIDALFGTGLTRPVQGTAADLVEYINRTGKTIISIDITTGLYADTCSVGNVIVQANHTLSFQCYKLAFLMAENNKFTGTVHLLDIGLHPKFYTDTPALFNTIDTTIVNEIYKPRNQFTHKYNFGHALLYAGNKNMMGAAILCAKACLRSGSGLVTIYTEENTQPIMQTALPEAITSTENDFESLSQKKSAIGIGPGISLSEINKALLNKIIAGFTGKLVIDASALHLLADDPNMLKQRGLNPGIITPHGGEFEKLFGKTNNDFERLELAMQKSIELKCYIVLKGRYTITACPDGTVFFNTNGNAGMATAGSGDVLTGILTGLLAQGYSQKNACLLGVYLHGMAGDIAAEKISQEAMIAGDILECIGEAFKKISALNSFQ